MVTTSRLFAMRPVIRLDAKPNGFATPAEGLKVAFFGRGSPTPAMSALGGWSQWIDATLYLKWKDGVDADGSKIWSRI